MSVKPSCGHRARLAGSPAADAGGAVRRRLHHHAGRRHAAAIHDPGRGRHGHTSSLTVGVSSFLSPEARSQLIDLLHRDAPPSVTDNGIVAARAYIDQLQQSALAKWLAIDPSVIQPVVMNGVQTDVVVPQAGVAPENKGRVLINLHGGGFYAGARSGGQAEAVPLAARGRIKVVTVDYRMAPEWRFPAASEDVEKVYVELLKTYRPENIGIYGCSAGGTLTAQAVAWLQHRNLPRPGAVGIFCSGAMPSYWFGGDSAALKSDAERHSAAARSEQGRRGSGAFLL